jgi:hypothetical protein
MAEFVDGNAHGVTATRGKIDGVTTPSLPLEEGPLSDKSIDVAAARSRMHIDS